MDTALKGEAALVTGASGGIGAAVAQTFASEGCSVGLHFHRNMSAARKLGEDMERDCNIRAVPIAADLRRDATRARGAAHTLTRIILWSCLDSALELHVADPSCAG